jgi:hypothetical protein
LAAVPMTLCANCKPVCGGSRTVDPVLPLSFFFLLFLLFVVMGLDAEEHDRAQHEQLESDKDYGNPIHDFLDTLHQQLGQWFKPSWMRHGIP